MRAGLGGRDVDCQLNYYCGIGCMKKKITTRTILWGLLLLIAIGVGEWVFFTTRVSGQQPIVFKITPSLTDRQQRTITIGSNKLAVEVVTSPESIEQGLSGRSEIGSDGMLFVFGSDRMLSFWMKEMVFDLDLIWLRDGRVVEITRDVPHPSPNTPLPKLPLYKPSTPVDMVLEVPAGGAGGWGIEIDDQMQL